MKVIVACDDGRVPKLGKDAGCTIASCIAWAKGEVVGVAFHPLRIDGLDATPVIEYLVLASSRGAEIQAVLLDSLTIAGFNVVSPPHLVDSVGAPLLVVYKYPPSPERLAEGLRRADLPYRSLRERVLATLAHSRRVETRRGTLYILAFGSGLEDAVGLVESLQGRDRVPVPLRLAHYISSALSELLVCVG